MKKTILAIAALLPWLYSISQNVGIGLTNPEQPLSVKGGMVVDQTNLNNGTTANTLRFGSSSGEAIGSVRLPGINQFGLDFYTQNLRRMSIANNGNVGIATAAPAMTLDVNGGLRIGMANTGVAGAIRFNNGVFEGYNQSAWKRFDQLPSNTIVLSEIYPNPEMEGAGFIMSGMINNQQLLRFYEGVAGNTWLPTATRLNIDPGERADHSAIWTGSRMIVWGGRNDAGVLKSGCWYDPGENVWRPINGSNAPAARASHSCVWTGDLMVIWGGDNGTAHLNTGGIYYLGNDSWNSTSMTGAPAGRNKHSTVWTGTEMIVWGGFDGAGTVNTGARFNPITNTWSAMTTTNAPSARMGHTAIWTGTEMIVWGGSNATGLGFFNTGARYNPATDTWTTISTTNAPSARTDHIAAWMNPEMIIWSGGAGVATASGGRYNPSTNTWTAIVPPATVSPRTRAKAIRINNDIYIWGGKATDSGNQPLLYTPSMNNWTILSTAGEPQNYERFSMVWTGREIIVFGGLNNPGIVNTGSRYYFNPQPVFQTSVEYTATLYYYRKK